MATPDDGEANFAPRGTERETIDRRPSDDGGPSDGREDLAFKGHCDGCDRLIPQASNFCMYCGIWRPFDTGYIGRSPVVVVVDGEVAERRGGER